MRTDFRLEGQESPVSEARRRFAKAVAEKREEIAKQLIEAGFKPGTVPIRERYWFDEQRSMMCYECWAPDLPQAAHPDAGKLE